MKPSNLGLYTATIQLTTEAHPVLQQRLVVPVEFNVVDAYRAYLPSIDVGH